MQAGNLVSSVGPKGKSSNFPSTRWSLVGLAGAAAGQAAIADLIGIYTPALRSWLVRAKRVEPSVADDVLQGFLVDKMVSGYLFQMADRGRGRFRNLVLKALGNYLNTCMTRDNRDRARLVVVENEDALGVGTEAEQEDVFDFAWAQTLVRSAIAAMRSECAEKRRPDVWEIFEAKVAGPFLEDKPAAPYEDLVLRFGFKAPREAVNLFVTARRMFHRCLAAEVTRYAPEEELEAELADLQRILLRKCCR